MSLRDEIVWETAREDAMLREAGLLDAGQPTAWGHLLHRRKMRAEFTPDERAMIRSALFGDAAGGSR